LRIKKQIRVHKKNPKNNNFDKINKT